MTPALNALERDVLFVLGRDPIDELPTGEVRRELEQRAANTGAAESVVGTLDILTDQGLVTANGNMYALSEQGQALIKDYATRLQAIAEEGE